MTFLLHEKTQAGFEAKGDGSAAQCPVCGASTFSPQEQIVDVAAELARWGEVLAKPVPADLSADYPSGATARLHSCSSCGFGSFLPPFAGTAEFYDFITGTGYYLSDRWDFRECERIIRRLAPASILDIGCGLGDFLDIARSASPASKTFGQDLNEAVVAAGLSRRGHAYLGSDVTALPAASMDLVTALQVLEHVPDPLEFVRAVARTVRPGGRLLLSVPDQDGLVSEFFDTLTEVPPHHVTRWTEASLRAVLERVGFVVEHVARQPLERYQWDAYLEPAVARGSWFYGFLEPFMKPEASRLERVVEVRALLEARGVTVLHGVYSHTILVSAVAPAK